MVEIVQIRSQHEEDLQWAVDRFLEHRDDCEEVLIIGKRRSINGIIKFHSKLRDVFWWMGILDAVKHMLFEEGSYNNDGVDGGN